MYKAKLITDPFEESQRGCFPQMNGKNSNWCYKVPQNHTQIYIQARKFFFDFVSFFYSDIFIF